MGQDWADRVRTTTYEKDVDFLLNDDPGKIMQLDMDVKSATGEKVQITDRFSDLNAEEISGRNQPSSFQDWDAERYWIHKPRRSAIHVLLDPDDEMETEVGLTGPLEMGVAEGIRRYRARTFFEGYYGNTWTGDTGTTQQAFVGSNVLPADTGETPGTYTGLTLNKLRKVRKKMKQLLIDLQKEKPIWIITAEEVEDLLEIDQYINSRYNPQTEAALQSGEITDFMGFRFLPYEFTNTAVTRSVATTVGQAVNASGHRRCPVFVPSGMSGREWLRFSGKKDERPDLNHSEQTAGYSAMRWGRRYPTKCLIVETN